MTILMSLVIWSFPISMQEIMGTPVLFMVHLKIILTKHWKLPTPLKGFLPHQNPSVLLSFLAMLPKLLQEAGIRFQTALSNCRNPLPIPIFPIKNGNYSLEGAKYGIYKGEELVETLVTDKKGYAKSKELAEGSYTVKEISAPEGFAIDPSAHNVTVKAEGTSTVKVKDIPQNNPVKLLLKKVGC